MPRRTVNRSEMEPYRRTVDEILNAFDTSAQSGLSQGQAQERLERYGRNELAAEAPVPAWRKFLAQFTDVLVILLLVAALISAGLWLYERDSALPYEAIAIFAIVLLNAIMGYVQQARAEQAVAALRQMSAAHANVIRDGARQSIPASGARARRHHPGRGGRHRSGRRAGDPVDRAANGGSGADRREPARVEGYRSDHAERRGSATATT